MGAPMCQPSPTGAIIGSRSIQGIGAKPRWCWPRERRGPILPLPWPNRPTLSSRWSDFPPMSARSTSESTGLLAAARPGMVLIDMTTTEPSLAAGNLPSQPKHRERLPSTPPSPGVMSGRGMPRSPSWSVAHQSGSSRHAIARMPRQEDRPSGRLRDGTTCQALQSDRHRRHDDRRVRESVIRLQSGARSWIACWILSAAAPRPAGRWRISRHEYSQRNFDPGFFVEHFIKDMGIALEEARRRQLTLPGLALAHRLYERVQALGHGRAGTHALMLALEDLSHIDLPNPPASP